MDELFSECNFARYVARDVRSRAKSPSLCHTARKCVHAARMCGGLWPALWPALSSRVHRHAHTRVRKSRTHTWSRVYTGAPQTRTYVHTRPPRHGLKGRDPNHFPKLLVNAGRVTRRLTFHCRPRAAPSRVAACRTGKKLKTQLTGLSIGRCFDSDLTRRRMFRHPRLIATTLPRSQTPVSFCSEHLKPPRRVGRHCTRNKKLLDNQLFEYVAPTLARRNCNVAV